ncbi:MAG: transglutaminase domain-containing protein [Candidatus Bathyarchaeia archaeon]
MTLLDQTAIEKYRKVSIEFANSVLIAKLRTLLERKYTLVELLDWIHEKVSWSDNEVERHSDPLEILAYGKGRCGEFSILFTALCLANGYRARLILDMTDHVWTEVWEEAENRWVHVDPSEKRVDDPLMYERDWKKSLSNVYAFENGKMEDVTSSYKMEKNFNG